MSSWQAACYYWKIGRLYGPWLGRKESRWQNQRGTWNLRTVRSGSLRHVAVGDAKDKKLNKDSGSKCGRQKVLKPHQTTAWGCFRKCLKVTEREFWVFFPVWIIVTYFFLAERRGWMIATSHGATFWPSSSSWWPQVPYRCTGTSQPALPVSVTHIHWASTKMELEEIASRPQDTERVLATHAVGIYVGGKPDRWVLFSMSYLKTREFLLTRQT